MGVVHALQVDPDDVLAVADLPGASVPIAGVAARRRVAKAERLQTPPLGRRGAVVGQIAVEKPEAVPAVFGEIDDPCARIDGRGLVLEATHVGDGDRRG